MRKDPARDQKLEHWLCVAPMFEPIRICDIKTPQLQMPVMSFNDNAFSALQLSSFPFHMVHLGQRLTLAHLAARYHKFGDAFLVGYKQFTPQETAELIQLSRDILEDKLKTQVGVWFPLTSTQDYIKFVGNIGLETHDTLMSSQLTLFWTAFETLANDLWQEAINAHPSQLAPMRSKQTWGKQTEETDKQREKKEEGKNLPMYLLEKIQVQNRRQNGNDFDGASRTFSKIV